MPPVNITTDAFKVSYISDIFPELTEIIAKELTCSSRNVHKEDIKINVFSRATSFQSADTRIEMYAFPYKERADNSDKICKNIKDYMNKKCPGAGSVDVFLYLTDLGYAVTK